MIGLLMVGVEC